MQDTYQVATETMNRRIDMGSIISSVIHDERLVDVNDNAKYIIVDNNDGIIRKLEEVVSDELGHNVKL